MFLRCDTTWRQSSRVGTRIRAVRVVGHVDAMWFRIGRPNASVFPDPVSAAPIISWVRREVLCDGLWRMIKF